MQLSSYVHAAECVLTVSGTVEAADVSQLVPSPAKSLRRRGAVIVTEQAAPVAQVGRASWHLHSNEQPNAARRG
jgi:hypothetical protein